jgi:hypothetical protein
MPIYKIEHIYDAIIRDISLNPQSKELENKIAFWQERKQDAQDATWQYLKLTDLLVRNKGPRVRLRATQGLDFPKEESDSNYPIGRIFLDSIPQTEVKDTEDLARKNGWTIEDSFELDIRTALPGKSKLTGNEIHCIDKKNRKLKIYLGPLSFYMFGLKGNLVDYATEFFGRLDSQLGGIIR